MRFSLSSESESDASSSTKSISIESSDSYITAEERDNLMDLRLTDVPTESDMPSHGLTEQTGKSSHEEQENFSIKQVLAEMRERDTKQKEEINSLREEMRSMISYIKGKSKDESVMVNPPQIGPTNHPQKEYFSGERPSTKQEAIKWPAPYDHKNQNEWTTTYGIFVVPRNIVDMARLHKQLMR